MTKTKKLLTALLLLPAFSIQFSAISAEDVVKLVPVAGSDSEYSVTELLRVELTGDSIRFIEKDGTVAAQVYKYDYVKLTVVEKTPTSHAEPTSNSQEPKAKKILVNGQVYILFGDKAYLINGQNAK